MGFMVSQGILEIFAVKHGIPQKTEKKMEGTMFKYQYQPKKNSQTVKTKTLDVLRKSSIFVFKSF